MMKIKFKCTVLEFIMPFIEVLKSVALMLYSNPKMKSENLQQLISKTYNTAEVGM